VKVHVRLFAYFREAAGVAETDLELADGATVDDLWRALGERHAKLRSHTPAPAVNRRVVARGTALAEGDEVAFLPPVSGG
jgi:molybdopterin converting factor subunit 1